MTYKAAGPVQQAQKLQHVHRTFPNSTTHSYLPPTMLHIRILYSPTTYAVLTAVLILGYAAYRAALPKPIPGIPYHEKSAKSVLGDAPPMVRHQQEFGTVFDWMTSQGGELNSPIFQLFLKPFSRPAVFLTDPREAQDVLLRRAKEFDRSQFLIGWASCLCLCRTYTLLTCFPRHLRGNYTLSPYLSADQREIPSRTPPPRGYHVQGLSQQRECPSGVASRCMPCRIPFSLTVDAGRGTLSTPSHLKPDGAVARQEQCSHRPRFRRGRGHQPYGSRFEYVSVRVGPISLSSRWPLTLFKIPVWEVAFGTQLRSVPDEIRFLKETTKFSMPASRDAPIVLPRPTDSEAVHSVKVITEGLRVITSPLPRQTHWLLRWTPSYRRATAYRERLAQEGLDDAKSRLLRQNDGSEEITGTSEFAGITCATDHMVRREAQAAAKEGRAPRYDSAEAKDELFGFLIGGHDTTATTLMWCVKLLTDSPRVQEKLRKILRGSFSEVDGDGIPSPEDITKAHIPYLEAVIEEVIRCSKTGPAAVRTALHDTTLLGHRIPKGVDVYMLANGPGYMEPNKLNESIPETVRSMSSQESKGRALPSWDATDVALFKPERWIKRDEEGADVFDSLAGPVMQASLDMVHMSFFSGLSVEKRFSQAIQCC